MAVIIPGAGCSITSTAAVSATAATGCFTFRAAFFPGALFGLVLATARLVAFARATLDSLRAIPRVADFAPNFPLFCTFDRSRLAMIPWSGWCSDAGSKDNRPSAATHQNELSTDGLAHGSGRKRPRKPRIRLRVHMTSLDGSRDRPRFILCDLRAVKAINSRSAKTNSRSAQWQLPLLQRVSMLASPRGDLHSRSSLQSPIKKMVASQGAPGRNRRLSNAVR